MARQPLLLPTTPAQVSGHRFLLRRLEHGLVLGDIRMIHDPLGRRRRAVVFGLVGCLLLCLGAGALALFTPRIDPGEAAIVVADSGSLFVRIEGRLHPVANLTSAQLIVGAPEQPARISSEVLAEIPRGVPVGLFDAPGVIDTENTQGLQWSACLGTEAMVVRAATDSPPALSGDEALLAEAAGLTYVLTHQGRQLLPPGDTPEGRVIRRRLGVDAHTPLWRTTPEFLNVVSELPEMRVPQGGEIWYSSSGKSFLMLENALIPLSTLQQDILLDLGFPQQEVHREVTKDFGDAPALLSLPMAAPATWIDPEQQYVCATGDDGVVSIADIGNAGVEVHEHLRYQGPGLAVGVDTGHGWLVIGDHGRRYVIADEATLAALGITDPQFAPWSIVRMLPEGSVLDKEHAHQPALQSIGSDGSQP